jgi:hypothetical protein
LEKFQELLESAKEDYIFISFDLDAVCGADAPVRFPVYSLVSYVSLYRA